MSNPKFAHRTTCNYCGVVDPWGFRCCQDCADRLAAEREAEDKSA